MSDRLVYLVMPFRWPEEALQAQRMLQAAVGLRGAVVEPEGPLADALAQAVERALSRPQG